MARLVYVATQETPGIPRFVQFDRVNSLEIRRPFLLRTGRRPTAQRYEMHFVVSAQMIKEAQGLDRGAAQRGIRELEGQEEDTHFGRDRGLV